jgi:hypothetical protein
MIASHSSSACISEIKIQKSTRSLHKSLFRVVFSCCSRIVEIKIIETWDRKDRKKNWDRIVFGIDVQDKIIVFILFDYGE